MAAVRMADRVLLAVRGAARVRQWHVWTLRTAASIYIAVVVAVAAAAVAVAAAVARWDIMDTASYAALLACGIVSIELTKTVREASGIVGRDLQTVWYLAIAITLPPPYAVLAPVPLAVYRLLRPRSAFIYRRVFSNATISLAYGACSVAFHAVPPGAAGPVPGSGTHVITWVALAAGCGGLAWVINNGLLLPAIRLADRATRVADLFGNRQALISDLMELSLAVSLALVVAINPVLMILALPSIVLYRRYLMSAQFLAQSRLDQKTGLLNAPTWRNEAEVELLRLIRARASAALVMVGIDHFTSVYETAGTLARDEVLRRIAGTLTDHVHDSALVGRLGPEEFGIFLPRAGEAEARRVGERLRDHVAGEPVAIESGTHAGFVFRLTVSIGISVLEESRRALSELMQAADTALSRAQSTGYNRVCTITAEGARQGWCSGDGDGNRGGRGAA